MNLGEPKPKKGKQAGRSPNVDGKSEDDVLRVRPFDRVRERERERWCLHV